MDDQRESRAFDRRTLLSAAALLGAAAALPTSVARAAASSSGAPEVTLASGRVRGLLTEGGGKAFLGIPYGRPPVRELRFAAPRKVMPWKGVRDAAAFGPSAPQPGVPTAGDNWLTVNVWAPENVSTPLPVMVWIYGGGYTRGGTDEPTYEGTLLAREGRVIVVTVNYRSGVEGFTWIDGAPPNRGLLDLVAALRWVNNNIRAFGGDPGRVTVFGESSGAGCVAALLAMPSAAGLFRRAIVQSMPRPQVTPELAAEIGAEIAATAGRGATAADLSQVPPDELAAFGAQVDARMASFVDRWGVIAAISGTYGPVVDGVVLPQTPYTALKNGVSRHVDLVIGHTRDENLLFSALQGLVGNVTRTQREAAVTTFAPRGDAAAYTAAFPGSTDSQLYELVKSDWLFRMPAAKLAEAHATAGGATYFYEFTHEVVGVNGVSGALHGMDVPLVFGNFRPGVYSLVYAGPPTASDLALGNEVRAAWTRFAHTGAPGWPEYRPGGQVKIWDGRNPVGRYPEETSRRVARGDSFGPYGLL